MADRLSEITIGYPHSKLNAGSSNGAKGLKPGQRIVGDHPFGSGNMPRFALMAEDSVQAQSLLPTLLPAAGAGVAHT